MALSDIQTIVFCMMENRSFDHALGSLSLDGPGRMPVEGLRSDPDWQDSWTNFGDDKPYSLLELALADPIDDPPHGRERIETQIDRRAKGQSAMGGFAQAYIDSRRGTRPEHYTPHATMGYYTRESVPTFDFFARNYCVCDHWFTPLPLGTQANRLMAMSGETRVVDNETGLPNQPLVYDWLKRNAVKWRAYQSGRYFPFFTMMDKWIYQILGSLVFGGEFRRYSKFKADWQDRGKAIRPVVFIEPEYSDGPNSAPNDDHPPTSIAAGQLFLRDVYETLISNPERWAKTLFIVTYDEHGGFFDHVPPLAIPADCGEGPTARRFERTGPRVPAFLISPFVEAGQVYSGDLDHTSFLAFLAERFTPGHGYSLAVNERQGRLSGRISAALRQAARPGPAPRIPEIETKALLDAAYPARRPAPSAPNTPNAVAFDKVARRVKRERSDIYSHPDMGDLRDYVREAPSPAPRDKDHISKHA